MSDPGPSVRAVEKRAKIDEIMRLVDEAVTAGIKLAGANRYSSDKMLANLLRIKDRIVDILERELP